MGYYINLKSISLDRYKKKLTVGYLMPSRQLLKNDIDKVFKHIQQQGIQTVEELYKALKTKKKLELFADSSDISLEYLVVLVREIKSNIPNPIKLVEFTYFPDKVIQNLNNIGIQNTLQLYPKVVTKKERRELAYQIYTSEKYILKLAKYTDLVRIRWVNHTFAHTLYEAGYTTIARIVKADYNQLYEDIVQLNKERQMFKGNIGLNDMRLLVEVSANVPQEIEY